MTALICRQESLPAHLAKGVKQATELIAARHSMATRIAYESDLREFRLWTSANGLQAFPASVETVVLYLTHLSNRLKPSSLARKVAAIKFEFRHAGLQSPTDAEPVKALLAGARRTKGSAPRQVNPATIDVVEKLLSTCDDSPRGHRDRALIALGFGAALRRSELAKVRIEDIEVTDKGLVLTLPRSKTDQEGRGQQVAVLDGQRLKIKQLLSNWLEASGITTGLVFPLTDRHIANIIKSRARAAGLDDQQFSGHSLRSGFLTSAAANGANLFRMMDVSRHRSINSVRGYVRKAQQFEDHAGSAFM
jgi:site-specific recombinase XerD